MKNHYKNRNKSFEYLKLLLYGLIWLVGTLQNHNFAIFSTIDNRDHKLKFKMRKVLFKYAKYILYKTLQLVLTTSDYQAGNINILL